MKIKASFTQIEMINISIFLQFRNANLAKTTYSKNRMRDMKRLDRRYQRIAVLIEQRQAEAKKLIFG